MKKIILPIAFFSMLSIILMPMTVGAAGGLVPCDGADCTICSFFQMLINIYDFIVKMIATPLAVIGITVGAIFMMISAGNPNLMSTGKKIFWTAIIGLALVFCSYLIIATVLSIIGYTQNWANLNISC